MKVLRRVDGDKPSIGFHYDDLERAKEEIKKILTQKRKNIFNIIDKRCEDKLKRPFHRAGHYLNLMHFLQEDKD